jgi:hypothetical protein
LVFGLISAGALAFCKYLHGEVKNYRKLLEQRENEIVVKTIEEKLKPVQEEIKKLELLIDQVAEKESQDIRKIIASWGFRITQLCEIYLEQGYMTQPQYIQLNEMYSLYHELGGNGKIKGMFEKTIQSLDVKK